MEEQLTSRKPVSGATKVEDCWFNPFTFKVIITIYISIAILLFGVFFCKSSSLMFLT